MYFVFCILKTSSEKGSLGFTGLSKVHVKEKVKSSARSVHESSPFLSLTPPMRKAWLSSAHLIEKSRIGLKDWLAEDKITPQVCSLIRSWNRKPRQVAWGCFFLWFGCWQNITNPSRVETGWVVPFEMLLLQKIPLLWSWGRPRSFFFFT